MISLEKFTMPIIYMQNVISYYFKLKAKSSNKLLSNCCGRIIIESEK